MASGGTGGEFEVEKGVEKTAVAQHPFGILGCCFQKSRLPHHDLGDVVGDGLWNADAVKLADMAMSRFLQGFGVCQPLAVRDLCGNPFMIFTEDERKEQSGINIESGRTPAVDLCKAFVEPVGFPFAVRRFQPGPSFLVVARCLY